MPQPMLHWRLMAMLVLTFLDGVGVVALLLLCYFLHRAFKITRSHLFLFFLLGFMTLAAGEAARTLMLLAASAAGVPPLAFFLAHAVGPLPLIGQTLAFLLIAVGYVLELVQLRARAPRDEVAAVLLVPPLLAMRRGWGDLFVLLGFVDTALLLFNLLNAIGIHLSSRSTNTLLPVIAFLLFLASTLLLPPAVIAGSEEVFILSKLLYVSGLLIFLALSVRVARA